MVKYCPRCGTPNPDNANFCAKCGYNFTPMTQQPPSPPQPYYQPPNQQPPTYPQPYNQPTPYQPPNQPYYQQPTRKKFPKTAIIGAVVAVVAILAIFLVVMPLSSPKYTLANAAQVAQSYYGGSWHVDSSATASYSGNGMYTVSFANGTTIKISASQLESYFSSELSLASGTPFGSPYYGMYYPKYQYSFEEYPPTKIVFEILNETGTNVSIVLVGFYWNYTPNYASLTYQTETQYLNIPEFQELIHNISTTVAKYGGYFNIYNSGGYDYLVFSFSNMSALFGYGTSNVIAEGGIAGVSDNIIAVAFVLNLAPTQSQLQTFFNMIVSSLST